MGKDTSPPIRRMRTKGPTPACVKPEPVQVKLEFGISSREPVKVKLEPGISLKQEQTAMKLEPGLPSLQTWRPCRRIRKKFSPPKHGRLLLDLMAKSAAQVRATSMQRNHRVAACAERATLVEAGNKYMQGWLCRMRKKVSQPKHGRLLLDLMAKSASRVRATSMRHNHRVAALAERATLVESGNKYMQGWLGCATPNVGRKQPRHCGGRPSRFAYYWETEMARRAQLKKDPEEVFLRGWLQGQAAGDDRDSSSEAAAACLEVMDLTAEGKLKDAEDIDSDSTMVPLEPATEEEEECEAETVSCVLQPFSSAPGAGEACQRLVPPPRLMSSLSPILRCGCGKSSQHRSFHRRSMGGVQEHALLDAMNKQFTAECASGASFLFLAACRAENQDLQWIVTDAESGNGCSVHKDSGCASNITSMVVGYTASQSGCKNTIPMNAPDLKLAEWSSFIAPDEILLLQQIWVEPQFRRRGVATEALRSLLTSQEACAVQAPTQLVHEILDQLGFQVLGQQRCSSGRQVCLFGRRASFCA